MSEFAVEDTVRRLEQKAGFPVGEWLGRLREWRLPPACAKRFRGLGIRLASLE